ncbi:MAG: hypothetical protein AMS18_17075 [Gemmatimonas sp. SG8_17]|nr:MAG: hypothetical protein AMS18_17075 [Gemmatimonas sp. SG8_17]
MSFRHLDQFAQVSSPITALAPALRVLGTVVVALGAATLRLGAWPQLATLAGLVLVLAAVARIPLRTLLLRMLGPLVFVLFASVALLFLVPGEVVARVWWIDLTDNGLLRFGSALGRAFTALAAAVILVSTTTFPEIVQALRELRLPHAVTTALGLAYRFLYVIVDELERLQRAARSRNAGAGAAKRRRLLVSVVAAVLRRALVRSERTHRAMLARGFHGEIISLHRSRVDARSIMLLALLGLVVGAVTLSSYLAR